LDHLRISLKLDESEDKTFDQDDDVTLTDEDYISLEASPDSL